MAEDYKEDESGKILSRGQNYDTEDPDLMEMNKQMNEDLDKILELIQDPNFRNVEAIETLLSFAESDNYVIRNRLRDPQIMIDLMDCAINSFAEQNFQFMSICFHCICILSIQTEIKIHSKVLKILLQIFFTVGPTCSEALESVIEAISITLTTKNYHKIPDDFYQACEQLLENYPEVMDTICYFLLSYFRISKEDSNKITADSPVTALARFVIESGNDRSPAKKAEIFMWLLQNNIILLSNDDINLLFFGLLSEPEFDNYETARIILNYASMIDENQISFLYDNRFVGYIMGVLQAREEGTLDGRTVPIQNYAFKLLYRLVQIAPSSFPSFFIQTEEPFMHTVFDAMINAPNRVRDVAGCFFGMLMNRFPGEVISIINDTEDDEFIDSIIHMLAMDLSRATYQILNGLLSIAKYSENGKEILFEKGIIDIVNEAIDDMVYEDNIDIAQELVDMYEEEDIPE